MIMSNQPPAPEIDIETLAAVMAAGAAVIDIREPFEHATGHVPGALLIPMGDLSARLAELDRGAPQYVICATGNRSLTVAAALIGAGFEAYSVRGGTTAWLASGRAVDTPDSAARAEGAPR